MIIGSRLEEGREGERREREGERKREREGEREQKCQLFFIISRYVKNLTFLFTGLCDLSILIRSMWFNPPCFPLS